MKVAIVIGVGAEVGLGAAISRKFATQGMHVVVAGRTEQSLEKVVGEIHASGGQASYCVTDATDYDAQMRLMSFAASIGEVGAFVFNVGNNMPINFDELTPEMFEKFWRVCTYAAFLSAKVSLPILEQNKGSLLFTGASASMRGRPGFVHFGAAKAALRNLAQGLAKDYGPKGVHVGHVVIDGAINGELLQNFLPEYLESLGEDGSLDPNAIAEAYWYLHSQPRNSWSFELDMRPFSETW
jgi:NAD(P)-dependent dehydrogenase (short-subunit alcohol dehydrogenase family)